MTGRTLSLGLPGAAGGCTVKSPLLLGKAGYAGRSTRAALGPALVSTVIERFVCRPSSNARRRGGGGADDRYHENSIKNSSLPLKT